ncbi:MAG: hypothetical protein ACYC06_01145 [Ilumatobacteraceae bacterium]
MRARISSPSLRAILGLAFVVVVLSACRVETVVTLDVKENGSGTLSVVTTADADVIAQAPGLADDLSFDDAKAAGWTVSAPLTTTEGGLQVSTSHDFSTPTEATLLMSQLSSVYGPFKEMHLVRTGKDTDSTWTLTGRLEVNGGLDAFADPALLKTIGASPYAATLANSELDIGKAISIEFRLLLPGSIESTTGVDTYGYPQWTVSFDGSSQALTTVTQNTAVKSTIARIVAPILFAGLIIWVISILSFSGFIALTRYKRSRRTPTA